VYVCFVGGEHSYLTQRASGGGGGGGSSSPVQSRGNKEREPFFFSHLRFFRHFVCLCVCVLLSFVLC
jgi:hypothetical protein